METMRNIILYKTLLLIGITAIFMIPPVDGQVHPKITDEEVHRIHEKALTIDTHCDTPMDIIENGTDIGKRNTSGQVDLPRMKEADWMPSFLQLIPGKRTARRKITVKLIK